MVLVLCCAKNGGGAAKVLPCRSEIHEASLFLAGLPSERADDQWKDARADPVYVQHSRYMDRFWENVKRLTIAPMAGWRPVNLPDDFERRMVFYPLSGADFINMYCLFPGAPFYLMVALEPEGDAPGRLNRMELASMLYSLQVTIPEFGMMNYFMSHIMQNAMTGTRLAGVAPVVMAFMARLGLRVCEVERVRVGESGTLYGASEKEDPVRGNQSPAVYGVRIVFAVPGEEGQRTLVYLCARLDNDLALGRTPVGRYVNSFTGYVTMLKSAIFFMHYDWIGEVRKMVLDRSFMIVQDDSGIPYRFFDPALWEMKLLGIYDPSYRLTNATVLPQADMLAAYPRGNEPLPFHYGYGVIINKSNMQIAVRKQARLK